VDQAARGEVQQLAGALNETVHLSCITGNQATDIVVAQGQHPLRFTTSVGDHMPLHASAVGKVMLGWRPEKDVTELVGSLQAYTPSTITSRDRFLRELSEVRDQGYALNLGELDVGTRCLAAPIRDWSGEVVAGLSVSAPVTRFPGREIERIREEVVQAADRISKRLVDMTKRES